MERKAIIELAKDKGMTEFVPIGSNALWEQIEKFVTFAVEEEREACAEESENSDHVVLGRGYYDQLGDADATVRNIASAIRARGQT